MGLLDLLIRPEDSQPLKATAPAPSPRPPAAPPAAPMASPIQSPAPTISTPMSSNLGSDAANEAKIFEKLNKAIEESNLAGIDFLEFYKAVSAMTMIPDEATRYRAAYSSLVAQGASADNIMKTADFYTEVLDSKEAGFAQYIESQTKDRVQSKLYAAEMAKKQIQEKSDQIARLTQEITKLSDTEAAARNEAAQAKAEIEAYQNTFKSVKARLCAEIQGIKQKIATYVISTPA